MQRPDVPQHADLDNGKDHTIKLQLEQLKGTSANLQPQSTTHVVTKDNIISTVSLNLGREELEYDTEEVQLTFEEVCEDKFEPMPTNCSKIQMFRSRMESISTFNYL